MQPRRRVRALAVTLLLVATCAAGGVFAWMRWGPSAASEDLGLDLVIALVLPDETDVVLPRVVMRLRVEHPSPDVYLVDVEHVDPLRTTEIPGTSYHALRDAYSFGGGAGLARATVTGPGPTPAYLIVGVDTWLELTAGDAVSVDVPRQIDVFDGAVLRTFPRGPARLSGDDVIALLNGADYLPAEERERLREDLGQGLLDTLGTARALPTQTITDLDSAQSERLLEALSGR